MVKNKFHRTKPHRVSLFKNLVTALIEHERIKTTLAKAKWLKRIGDRVVTMSKEGTLNSRRKLAGIVRSKDAQHKVFTILAERYKERAGGYTRVLRCNLNRKGDNAPMAWIEYVDRPGELRPTKPPTQRLPYSKMMRRAMQRKDEDTAEYAREMQEAAVKSYEQRMKRLSRRKIHVDP